MSGEISIQMSGDSQKLFKELAKTKAKLGEVEKKLGQVGRASGKMEGAQRRAFKEGSSGATSLITKLAGPAGVAMAVRTISSAYGVWLTNIKEVGIEARRAANEFISLAALQAGGTKGARVQSSIDLMSRFGIKNRGQGFDTIQAIQSARGGDFEAGLAGAETVFAASQLGIPIESGTELAVLGAAQGAGRGEFLRKAFVAGQLSSRDPSTLAKAAPALTFFEDKDVGFAAAGVLAGSIKKDELNTFVKAAGIGLSKASAEGFQKTLAGLGVADGTKIEKLAALKAAGIDTPEKLKLAGLGEIRQQQAIATLVENLEAMKRFAIEIPRLAQPGLFAVQRTAVESELPQSRLQRGIDILEVKQKDAQAFGPNAIKALRHDADLLAKGTVLRRLGKEQGVFGDLIDDNGRMIEGFWAVINRAFSASTAPFNIPGPGQLNRLAEGVKQELGISGSQIDALIKAAEEIAANGREKKDTSLGSPDVDK